MQGAAGLAAAAAGCVQAGIVLEPACHCRAVDKSIGATVPANDHEDGVVAGGYWLNGGELERWQAR